MAKREIWAKLESMSGSLQLELILVDNDSYVAVLLVSVFAIMVVSFRQEMAMMVSPQKFCGTNSTYG